jgi:hypothetical protein
MPDIITASQQYYSKKGNKPAILQQARQQTRYYNNNPTNITASNKPDITSKYQAQPESRAHFSVIYQSRLMVKYQSQPMTKYQSQPTKVSSIIENHRLRSEESNSTQTLGYNYITTTTRQQASDATNKQASKATANKSIERVTTDIQVHIPLPHTPSFGVTSSSLGHKLGSQQLTSQQGNMPTSQQSKTVRISKIVRQ